VAVCSTWTLLFTLPRWQQLVVAPMYDTDVAEPSTAWAAASYALHSALVGLHTLAFFQSLRRVGTVAVAVSKGAQQAATFICAHFFFCHVDPHECFWRPSGYAAPGSPWQRAWDRWQKPVAFTMCCAGCVVYMLAKEGSSMPASAATMLPERKVITGAVAGADAGGGAGGGGGGTGGETTRTKGRSWAWCGVDKALL